MDETRPASREESPDRRNSDATVALRAPKPGTMLGSYRIDRLLGRGGMGSVFLAHDTTLHRPVAIKVLDSTGDGATARDRLLREARNAAALNHPNICTIHEVGDHGSAFIAMEYVDGPPLSDRIAAAALPLEEVLHIGIQVADALAHAHEHGVVHRDFKAANVIVGAGGRIKIVDFGLARRTDALLADATTIPSLAVAGGAVGTPYSMAPEQARGGMTDARSDIWALGVLLYEMVSGAKPFRASTVPELFSSILRDAPAPLPASVPAEMVLIIERCLEKDPERRYQRADEVRRAIEAIQAGTTPACYVPPNEAVPRVKAAAMKAVELDPALALAHYALGMAAWSEWDWETSESELRRTIELEPNLADVRAFYSHLLIALKRPEEALAEGERALQLDPFNAFIQALYGVDLYFVSRYDDAIVQLQSALKTSPGLPFAHCVLWHAFGMKSMPEQALMGAEGCLGHYSREVKDALARGNRDAGYRGAMRRVADLLSMGVSGTYVAPIDVFSSYLHAGQKDLALEWLSKAVDARAPNVYGAFRDPLAGDAFRDDPRFQDLVRRTGLPI